MRGREHLLAAISRELTLISRHQLVTAARGVLERSAYLILNRIDVTGPMTARELADALQLEISTVTRQVAAMLREDVVERIPDPAGGLARRLRITPTGATRLATDRERYRTGLAKLVTDWPDDDCTALYRLLRDLNERIENLQGTPWPREDD
ncbi:MarR family winged helix-turn-helix transcriptional regulator [Actinophytocola oryzae]|uniref:DNA-binding MarR family transcriptional regulator n=1 Tax=Actinophytocola oryzae TaxID=502181 RepID=A0A4R7VWH7_9PSEU|nr:MarR family winged helix-turn-helix transcriptional regulator [Actinophytocola oryzae]TDV53577.1 DNA-binding MarR family transcriptional regulator [Actinophytocola oryzae]